MPPWYASGGQDYISFLILNLLFSSFYLLLSKQNKTELTTVVILVSKATGEQLVSKIPVQLSP